MLTITPTLPLRSPLRSTPITVVADAMRDVLSRLAEPAEFFAMA